MSLIRKARNFSRKDLYIGPLIPGLIVFFALMVIIGLSWRTAKQDVAAQYQTAVTQSTAQVEDTLIQRFGIYEDTLRSSAGLFDSSDSVTRSEWRSFVSSLKLPTRYPGVRSVGFIKIVSQDEKEDFIASVRAEGVSDYDILPSGERDSYAAITYVVSTVTNQSDSATTALGFDMYSDIARREAMDRAALTGELALSGKVNLNRIGTVEERPGFVMFMPVYTKGMPTASSEERKAALSGFTYAPFVADSFFTSLFTINNPNFSFAIYDGPGTDTTEYFRSSKEFETPAFTTAKVSNLRLYGQIWSVLYKTKSKIVADSLRERPLSLAYGGTIFAFVTAMMVYLLIQRRTSLLAFAEQRRLEEAKDDLLSLASHQLRTPATAVKQYISMVRDGYAGKLSKKQIELLEMAYESNERQLTIVDDLLYVARLDAGQASLSYEKFDIREIVRSVIDDQRSLVVARGQSVKYQEPNKKVIFEGDPKYIRMILENLLSNASKYSRADKKISIRLRTDDGKAYISFKDQGVGISEENYDNVFLKFSRIPNELTRQTSGSGIGLYLARQLARLHEGDILLDSSLDSGSNFTVELPLRRPHA